MKKGKMFFSISLAVIVCTLIVAGTLAYLTDTQNKTNVFTVGKVGITLTEPNWDKGIEVSKDYAKIIPGKTIPKDPTVKLIESSEPAYIRVKVTIPAALKSILEDINVNEGWVLSKTVGNDYYYEYKDSVTSASQIPSVFNEVVIQGAGATNEKLEALKTSDLNITIVAQAIQSAGFTDSTAAWKAFDGE
ncbi:MAG: SipW-dependent-type signal peptide-containing protein [Bacillota bacterium]|nr:SipW-dependent-type signal peptide-containing protein [Bacillota bacterium]